MKRLILALLPLTLAATATPARASLRCGNALITEGRSAHELRVACGPPAHVARRTVLSAGPVPGARVSEEVETWTYPGDGSTFTRLVEVRRGQIAAIATVAYQPDTSRCLSPGLGAGASIGELELACGAPLDRSAWTETRYGRRGLPVRVIHFERWLVSAGPGRFMRMLDFEDGRLVRVSTGARE